MFEFKSIVDQVAKASKSPLMYVEDKAFRTSLETVVDSYAQFTKTLYDTTLDISKHAVETVKSYDFAKAFANSSK